MKKHLLILAAIVTISLSQAQGFSEIQKVKVAEQCRKGKATGPGCDYLLIPPPKMTLEEFLGTKK